MAKERKRKRGNQEEEQEVSASKVLASACIAAASGFTTAATSFTAACTTVGTALTTVATAFTSAAAILSSTSPKEKVPTAATFASTSAKEKVATAAASTSTKTAILALPCAKAASSEKNKINEFFTEFEGRRAGIIKALTKDYHKFKEKCHPENGHLCLYGLPNGTWNVDLPEEFLPPNLPQPKRGINVARDRMNKQEWVAYVSIQSDVWLIALASYRAYPLKKESRTELFRMIHELPTIFEVVTRTSQKQANVESSGEDPAASCSKRARKAGKMKKY